MFFRQSVAAWCMVLFLSTVARDIVPSGDTLMVVNIVGGNIKYDSLTLVNNGSGTVRLDSLRIRFTALDTTGIMIHEMFFCVFNEIYGDSLRRNSMCELEAAGDSVLRYVIDTAQQYERNLLSIGASGGTATIISFSIGLCPYCASINMPALVRGTIDLFYSSGEVVTLQLKSMKDYAVPSVNQGVRIRPAAVSVQKNAVYLVNGRAVTGPPGDYRRKTVRQLFVGAEGDRYHLYIRGKK